MSQRPVPSIEVVPVIAEEIVVEKVSHEVESVVVTKHLTTEHVRVDLPRFTEHVDVARIPVERVVAGPIPPRQEGDTTVISVVEEIAVVSKQYVLREEIRITKQRVDESRHADLALRREVVDIQRRRP